MLASTAKAQRVDAPAELAIRVEAVPDALGGRFWHTDVYERRDGRWQVVWSQATQVR